MSRLRERNDCFAGNLGFETTEQQLYEVFSKVGPVKRVRLQTEKDTGASKGFAFIEYEDAATALSAIRNLDGFDLNGRKIRVSFTNTSGLKDLAKALGHDVPDAAGFMEESNDGPEASTSSGPTVKEVINGLKPHDAYDLLASIKAYIEEDRGVRAKVLFKEFPQLTTAFSEIQLRLGMGLGITASDLGVSDNTSENLQQQQQQYIQYQQQQPPVNRVGAPPSGVNDLYLHAPDLALPMHHGVSIAPSLPLPGFQPHMAMQGPMASHMPYNGGGLPNEQELLFHQVMQMTDYDLMMMPEQDRVQIMLLKQELMSQMGPFPPQGIPRY